MPYGTPRATSQSRRTCHPIHETRNRYRRSLYPCSVRYRVKGQYTGSGLTVAMKGEGGTLPFDLVYLTLRHPDATQVLLQRLLPVFNIDNAA